MPDISGKKSMVIPWQLKRLKLLFFLVRDEMGNNPKDQKTPGTGLT